MEFRSRMLGSSHFSEFYLGWYDPKFSRMFQGARLPLITSSSHPECCLGAPLTSTINPPPAPAPAVSPRWAWLRSYQEVWCFWPTDCSRLFQEAPLTCPAETRVKVRSEAPPRLCSPTSKWEAQRSHEMGGWSWHHLGSNLSSTIFNCLQKGKLLDLLAPQFSYPLNGDSNTTISWGYNDCMQYWAGVQEFNTQSDYY